MAFFGRKKQPASVACYGKLRATGDFVRHNATGTESTSFDGWLNQSIAAARQSLGAQWEQVYPQGVGLFVYRGDDGGGQKEPERGMIGVWAASGDSAGRVYPMTVAATYDYEEMLAVGPALPIAVWPFLQSAYDLVVNGRGMQVPEFIGRVKELQPVSIENAQAAVQPYRSWLQQQRMRALWETAFGSVDYRFNAMHSIHQSVEFFQGQERPQTNLAIRFPIGAGDAYATCVWMDAVTRMAKWQRTVLNAFWTPQYDCTLHLGPPHVATFRELIAPSGNADHVSDLLAPPTTDPNTARDKLGALGSAVDNVDQTIAAFLDSL